MIDNPKIIPFEKDQWQPFFDAMTKYFTNIKEDKDLKLSDNAEKFVDKALDSLSKLDNDTIIDSYKYIYLLLVEKRFDEIDDTSIKDIDKQGDTAKEIGRNTHRYYKYLHPKFDNVVVDSGLTLKLISKYWRALIWMNSVSDKKITIDPKTLEEVSILLDPIVDKELTLPKINRKLEGMKKTFPKISDYTGITLEEITNKSDTTSEKDDNGNKGNDIESTKDKGGAEKEDTDIKYFFNNVAVPDADLNKLTGFILDDIKKKGFSNLDTIVIEICSNGLRNNAIAENLSFKELNENRYGNTKKSIVEALKKYKETSTEIKFDPEKLVFERKSDMTIHKKVGDIEQDWKVSVDNGLVGPPSPYEKMVDITGNRYDYYKAIGKTLNTVTNLEGNLPVGFMLESRNRNLTITDDNLPKGHEYKRGIDQLVSSHIFVLDIDPNIKPNTATIKEKLLASTPIAVSEITKENVNNLIGKVAGKTILVNFNNIKGASLIISKMYEPLNILKVEWKGSNVESEKHSDVSNKNEPEKNKLGKRKVTVTINSTNINKCAYECDLSVA